MKEKKLSPAVTIGVIAVVVVIAAAAIWQFSSARRTAQVTPEESLKHVPIGKPMGAGPRSGGSMPGGPPRMGPPGSMPGGPPRMGPPGGMGGSGR
ncbi:MAG: hypothetical protein NZT92_19315 [Abditibacteriales bacterium]|nr:hypothetical protein [Abditibacteriales bacterium]MDW8367901.1 hypothetical protein [Abditibacteriales bacterium]